jgi:hypothetical protein
MDTQWKGDASSCNSVRELGRDVLLIQAIGRLQKTAVLFSRSAKNNEACKMITSGNVNNRTCEQSVGLHCSRAAKGLYEKIVKLGQVGMNNLNIWQRLVPKLLTNLNSKSYQLELQGSRVSGSTSYYV